MHARFVIAFALVLVLACNNRDRAPTIAASAERTPAKSVAKSVSAPVATPGGPVATVAALPAGYRTEDEKNSISVFRLAAPSTVFVTQKRLRLDYFGGTATEVPAGSGTGFVWDKLGHVVTNFHVIRRAQTLSVTMHDQRTYDAELVGVEPRKDIAVLRIKQPESDLIPIRVMPKGTKLEVGQKTIAIGNPFGLDQTLTTGVISALGRQVQGVGGVTIRDMVQTDAAINPGNSGGPLLNSAGELIGMNTLIFSRSGASAGIGFAVPVSSVRRVVPQIIKTGKAEQVGLGVQIDPNQRLERRLRIKGVVVLRVVPNSPAAAAGLQGINQSRRGISLGDVIVGINAQRVDDYDDLYNILDQHRAGEEVSISVAREGQVRKVKLKLIRLQ